MQSSQNRVPKNLHHIHILGICGTGMAALAGMLKSLGYHITGSDSGVYPPMSDFLATKEIEILQPYAAHNLHTEPDLVIIGNVIRRSNPEALEVERLNIPYLSFPQALAHFFINSRKSLVVAGTHGKTTSCSLLASALYHAAADPTFMIGGIVREFASNFRIGDGPYFVAEGDEYDTAFFDKESKFLHYQPHIAIITSLEFDHADIFADFEQIKRAFANFINLIPENGLLIANFDNPDIVKLAQDARCQVLSYGEKREYNWSLSDVIVREGRSHFTLYKNGKKWHKGSLQLPGKHNCLNALAVAAVMDSLGFTPEQSFIGLENFAGVKRRQEIRGIESGITVIDDFAHHPTAVHETLTALKAAYPEQRLVTVFEPRTNSSRRNIFQKQYSKAFTAADHIVLREPIPLDGVAKEELFSSQQLCTDLQKQGSTSISFANTDDILEYLQTELQTGDVVAILSNGGFDNIHLRLLEILKTRA